MRTNGRFLFNVLYVFGCGMCLGALVSSPEVKAEEPTPLYEYEETTKPGYHIKNHPSCSAETVEGLADCVDDTLPLLSGDPVRQANCGISRPGRYTSGNFFYSLGTYAAHNATQIYVDAESQNRYGCDSTPGYRIGVEYVSATIVEQTLKCNAVYVDTFPIPDGFERPERGSNCIRVTANEGCAVDTNQIYGEYLAPGANGPRYGWSGYSTGAICTPCGQLLECEEGEPEAQPIPEYVDEPDTENPFYCGTNPDGEFYCLNLQYTDEEPPFIEYADNQQGLQKELAELESEGCTVVAEGQYVVCPEGQEPAENTNENSDDDRTLVSTAEITNSYTSETININTYTYEGSANEYGQPDEDINDTGGDTDGDGDSDGDTDGDGDSDNADVIAKLNEIKAKQAGTNSKLNTISNQIGEGNQKLDGIKSSVDGLGDKLDGVKDAVEDLNNADEFSAPTDGEEYGDSLNNYWGRLQNAPIIQAVDNVIPAEQEGSCPPLEFELFDWGTVGTTMHCDLWEQATPIIEVMAVVAWSLLGLFILLSA